MNKVFRLIWSAVRQCWIVAAEKVTSKGGIPARTVGALSVAVLLACGTAHALPTDGTVAAGSATISNSSATAMQITQTSNRAVINWQSFGIAKGEAVNITQPSAQAALLNRVIGNSSSEIYGSLTANGQVFLVNPNGVLFAKGASVNVGGLVASSLNITDDNFMNNNLKFFKDGTAGSITNQGSITAGFAALLGPQVDNSGSIITYKGSTALGAANAVTLNFDTSGLIALTLTEGAYNAQVQNSGIIEADGGRVLLTAKSADSILKSMVNNDGIIRARSVDTSNGQILLLGDMDNGTVKVGGTLDASAPNGGNGGFIETSAHTVQVADGATITTLAPNGSTGTWLIDPYDFTISSGSGSLTSSGIGATTLATSLGSTNVTLATTNSGGSESGDINVNAAVSWSSNKTLTLSAYNDININADISASSGTLKLYYGQGTTSGSASSYSLNNSAKVTLSSGNHFYTKQGSSGTETSWYVITSLGNAGSTTGTDLQGINGNLSGHYVLGADIDASATSGWNSNGSGGYYGFASIGTFTGSFDGLGHVVSDLYINRPSTNYVGLFSFTSSAAVIRNLGLVGANVTGQDNVGGLVGQNAGSISTSYAIGSVVGNGQYSGGLVGYNYSNGAIDAAYASGSVTGGTNTTDAAGGLVGRNDGSISNAYASGNVNGGGVVGGLVGYNGNTITASYATGSVNGVNDVGGLVGYNILNAQISNTYATGNVSGTTYVGGVVGKNEGTISTSYWNTETTGQTSTCGAVSAMCLSGATGLTTAQMQTASSFSVWGTDISSTGGSSAVWRIYDGYTYPLLRSFLTSLTLTPSYDGSGTALTNIAAVTGTGSYDSSKVLGNPGTTLTLSSSSAGSYTASANAGSSGLYSTQQGYDLSYADRTITTTGSAAGNIVISSPITWSSGTLAINTSGTVTANAAVNGAGSAIFDLQSGTWSQINSSLPSFSAYDFRISGGTFIRALAGDGTSSSPYELADIYGVQGTGSSGMLGKSYLLANDIDASATTHWNSGAGFKPIGDSSHTFTGSFDGQSHTIDGLTIDRDSEILVGLFGINYGAISNLTLTNVDVTGNFCVGALVGCNMEGGTISNVSVQGSVVATDESVGLVAGGNNDGGTISNATASGSVSGVSNVGGLVGVNWGVLSNASASATVSGTYDEVGGLVGENAGSISNSHASGDVSGNQYVGGLVGHNVIGTASDAGQITNVYATGTVSGSNYVGGLIGTSDANTVISNAYATGNVTGSGAGVGGLVGVNDGGSIGASHATGSVTGGSGSTSVGGLVGENWGSIATSYATGNVSGDSLVGGLTGYNFHGDISNSYAIGSVTASGDYVGGLAGSSDYSTISNSYATGAVAGGSYVGGLVGYNNSNSTIANSFFNSDTSGQSSAVGDNSGTLTNVTGKTTTELKTASTFSGTGWDISTTGGSTAVWRIYDGVTTPLLRSFLTPLTITANNDSKTYNGVAYNGGNGVSYSVSTPTLSGTLAYSGSSQGATNVGTYSITPGGFYSNQQGYDISFASGILTIRATTDIPETLPATGVTSGPSNLSDQLVPLLNSLNPPSKTWTPSELLQLQALESKRSEIHNLLGSVSNDLIVIINGGVRR